jgi:DNA-binding transcriptional LysR family regulator
MGAIKEMAKVGVGVGIVAPWVVRSEIEEGSLVAIPLGIGRRRRSWGLLCHESRQLRMVEEDFLRLCRKVAKTFIGEENGKGKKTKKAKKAAKISKKGKG